MNNKISECDQKVKDLDNHIENLKWQNAKKKEMPLGNQYLT
jgi:hypothetical protein